MLTLVEVSLSVIGTVVVVLLIMLITAEAPWKWKPVVLWITRLKTAGLSTSTERTSALDPRLSTDAAHLSTSDLVLCWTMIDRLMDDARRRGHWKMVSEFSERLLLVERELKSRQGTLEVDQTEKS